MTRVGTPLLRLATALLVATGLAACRSSPTAVQILPLEMSVASGDGQFGVVNQELGAPLRVQVRSLATKAPRRDVSVLWSVLQGSATIVGVTTTLTDSTGSTQTNIRVGGTPGEIRVRASVAGQETTEVTFTLYGVNQPAVTQISPASAAAGETVVLTGTDFSPVAAQNVVLFSGVRGRVIIATSTSLQVEVPLCLPPRTVGVTVQLGAVPGTGSQALTITGGQQLTNLQVGQVIDVADDQGLTCHALPGGVAGTQEYLGLVYTSSGVGAAQHPFSLTALSYANPGPAPLRAPARHGEGEGESWSLQGWWDERLRELEGRAIRSEGRRAGDPLGPARTGPAPVPPTLGETRMFNVLNASGGFDRVTAVAQHIGSRAAIYVDQAAPTSGGFDASDLAAMSARFDGFIHPQVTSAFGAHSDIDQNERVIILFTPSVNRLTPRGSSGFIGGFFYGVDLLTASEGSNRAEIFYALVPDAGGQFSTPINKTQVLQAVPAVLAHEFQHMVHFNERVVVRGAAGQESLWLAEGLAQMAEELVARAYAAANDPSSAQLFRSGAISRARRYLAGTDSVSLVVTSGQGSLAERGAGFLFTLYLEDQLGVGVLGALTRTTRTGVPNVEAETGSMWPDLIANWWSAIYLDGPAPESGPLTYPTIDLRGYLGGTFPLVPAAVGPGDRTDSGSLLSSSARYLVIRPPAGGSLAIRLGGAAGGPSPSQSGLRLRLIRIS